jgi:Spy/CpxP family protein refolding chaperone
MKKTLAILASALSMSAAFAQTAAPAGASAPAMSAAASQTQGKARHEQRVEERINYLHSQLKITSAQESQWNAFADVMRNNSETMGNLFAQRRANANMSALDDMKGYAEITQAHADGTKKLVDAFEPLYTSFSPEQKKLADETFRRQPAEGGHGHHRRSGKPAAPASDATVKP